MTNFVMDAYVKSMTLLSCRLSRSMTNKIAMVKEEFSTSVC